MLGGERGRSLVPAVVRGWADLPIHLLTTVTGQQVSHKSASHEVVIHQVYCSCPCECEGMGNPFSSHRECNVRIENSTKSYCLKNLRTHIISGDVDTPLPTDIKVATTGKACFTKTPWAAKGAVGVFTYDLVNSGSESLWKIAVMFSVPYDFVLYHNWFAVGIFDSCTECDYDMYELMYLKDQHHFRRKKAKDGHITYKHGDIVFEASMSDTITPKLKLTVKEDEPAPRHGNLTSNRQPQEEPSLPRQAQQRGAAGVFTYDLVNIDSKTTSKMAVMFSVPFDFNIFSNWFAVGVFTNVTKCDDDLFNVMYSAQQWCFVRNEAKDGNLTYKHGDVVIEASMSDTYTPKLKLTVKQEVALQNIG
ncbi:DELTA-sagatoxin-Srs1a [Merluccius polli]|uniref:DELTA-sagatoxin-Srs1a n=1 Tax=Merluccius polli TaxID=89951 RepID=A0AA47NW50_MERPO|nr:DELTA-sagatoxin-Srs1a [Merluccius polli]